MRARNAFEFRGLPNPHVPSKTYRDQVPQMCDEYYDARMKAFWRAVAEESDLELDEKEGEPAERPIVIDSIELPRAKPKSLLR